MRIHIVCGSGNNGGDGYEIARLARAAGRQVTVWQVGAVPENGDALIARSAWLGEGGVTQPLEAPRLAEAELIVDALFGTGLNRTLEGEGLAAVRAIHAAARPVLAVDLPSGLHADTGVVLGEAVRATVTLSFVGRKLGLHTAQGPDHCGEVFFDGLGLPAQVHEDLHPIGGLLDVSDLRGWLPPRSRSAHKGSHGHVLVVGGDQGMLGAALLAGRAALRAGAGLVTVATRALHAAQLSAAQPELMSRAVETPQQFRDAVTAADVIAIGPGLGQEGWGRLMLGAALESAKPLVMDADALNLLAAAPQRREAWVLTPHPGEAARLLGCKTSEIQVDRRAAVAALQKRYGGVVVLKGAGSLVQGRGLSLCPYGNPGMGVGGMGDVLTGIVAAFIGQGLALETAAAAAVLAHARAGDAAAVSGERGLLPSDLLLELRRVVNP